MVLDSNREVRLSNRAAQSLLGSSSLITLGSPLVGVFREPLCLSNLARAFAGEGAEWDLKRNPKILRVRAFPIDLDPGETYGVLVTLDDITRQEALETTRQKFISNASHELKTPATSIRIAAENLLEGNLVIPEGETSLRIIIRSVERMAMLLNDISELSQIETGATALEPAPILLGGFLEGVLEDVSSQAQARQIRLTSHLEEGLEETTLITDPHRLHQLLDNLLNNAIKFSPEQAEVKLLGARDGEWVSLSVVDQGTGHRRNRTEPDLRAILSLPPHPGGAGHGPGPSHRQAPGLPHGGRDLPEEFPGCRCHIHPEAPPGRIGILWNPSQCFRSRAGRCVHYVGDRVRFTLKRPSYAKEGLEGPPAHEPDPGAPRPGRRSWPWRAPVPAMGTPSPAPPGGTSP